MKHGLIYINKYINHSWQNDGNYCFSINPCALISKNLSLNFNYAWDLLLDSQDRMWVSTWGAGLNLYLPSSETFIPYLNDEDDSGSPPANNVWSVFEDAAGRIWVCSEGGLSLFNDERQDFKTYKHVKGDTTSIAHPVVTAVRDGVEVLARFEDKPVLLRQDNILAASFHPELTGDTRIHKYFLTMVSG